jgi:hypothetical protein
LRGTNVFLSITTTAGPATDLGYLLHKNPARVQSFDLSFGKAHVFYPEAQEDRCTMALLLDVDPVGLVRGRSGPAGEGGALEQYVNDRPYVASSFLAVAISRIFGTALSGRSKERPEFADRALPFEVHRRAPPHCALSSLAKAWRRRARWAAAEHQPVTRPPPHPLPTVHERRRPEAAYGGGRTGHGSPGWGWSMRRGAPAGDM